MGGMNDLSREDSCFEFTSRFPLIHGTRLTVIQRSNLMTILYAAEGDAFANIPAICLGRRF